MWVIGNGAPKNGSTWLMHLLDVTGKFERVPDDLQAKHWENSSVALDLLPRALMELPTSETMYLSKQHWAEENAEFLAVKEIKLLDIIRDARDMVVSHYHHNVRINNEILPINKFILKKSESLIANYCVYHDYWNSTDNANAGSFLFTSYEYLTFDLVKAASEIYAFVGLTMDSATIEKLAKSTLFENKKKTGPAEFFCNGKIGPGEFFRKGKAFAFKEEIGKAEEQFILDCCQKYDLKKIKTRIAERNPNLVKYLSMTDIGM